MITTYKNCNLCPRKCSVDRTKQKGACMAESVLRCARASLHMWEEPCISGARGSGTVFFSGCPLHCVYCQNEVISSNSFGIEITTERLSKIFFELEDKGAENINLVTPSHYTPHVIEAIKMAKSRGLSLPFVFNSGGFESVETLRQYEGLIDIYLPDMKTASNEKGKRYYHAENYPETNLRAVEEMKRQCDDNVIIRHLVLPEGTEDAMDILDIVCEYFGRGTKLSLMSQYVPMGELEKCPELCRRLTIDEYERVVDYAWGLGMENVYTQDIEAATSEFIPCFDGSGIIK